MHYLSVLRGFGIATLAAFIPACPVGIVAGLPTDIDTCTSTQSRNLNIAAPVLATATRSIFASTVVKADAAAKTTTANPTTVTIVTTPSYPQTSPTATTSPLRSPVCPGPLQVEDDGVSEHRRPDHVCPEVTQPALAKRAEDGYSDSDSDLDSDTDTGMGSDSDYDSGLDSYSESDSYADSYSDSDYGSDWGSDSDSDPDSGYSSGSGSGSDSDSDSDLDSEANPNTDTDMESNTESESDSDPTHRRRHHHPRSVTHKNDDERPRERKHGPPTKPIERRDDFPTPGDYSANDSDPQEAAAGPPVTTKRLERRAGPLHIRSISGLPATSYLDPLTKYTFLGIRDLSGYMFGIILPPAVAARDNPAGGDSVSTSSDKDAIIQIVSPLNKAATGWGGVVFGPEMTGALILVVWPSNGPDTDGKRKVLISPRIASGYNPGAVKLYTETKLTFRKIEQGTFVNSSHVGATFVCGGCVGAEKSFGLSGTGTGVFSFAYSWWPITTDSGAGDSGRTAIMTDHTHSGERTGDFDVDFGKARSNDYDKLVGLAEGGASGGVSSGGGSTTAVSSHNSTTTPTANPATPASSGSQSQNGSTDLNHGSEGGGKDGSRTCVCECKCPPCSVSGPGSSSFYDSAVGVSSDTEPDSVGTDDGEPSGYTDGFINYKPADMWYGFTKGWFGVLGIMAFGYFWGVWMSF